MSHFSFQQPFTGVVRHLIIINALMFVGTYALLGEEIYSTDPNAVSPYLMLGRMKLAVFLPGSDYFRPYQVVTHMFMHANLGHLAFNMISLYFFGPMVEMVWGARRFLFYYLFCGLGSWALYTVTQMYELEKMGLTPAEWPVPMLGASGAIFGVLAAFAFHFPNYIIRLMFPPIELKAKYFVLIMAGFELYSGMGNMSTGVAHFAHLGGAAAGFLLIGIWYNFRYR